MSQTWKWTRVLLQPCLFIACVNWECFGHKHTGETLTVLLRELRMYQLCHSQRGCLWRSWSGKAGSHTSSQGRGSWLRAPALSRRGSRQERASCHSPQWPPAREGKNDTLGTVCPGHMNTLTSPACGALPKGGESLLPNSSHWCQGSGQSSSVFIKAIYV